MWVDNNSSHKWTIREPGQLEKWTIREDLLYINSRKRRVKVIVSPEEQVKISDACHSDSTSGHFGVTKTRKNVSERFYRKAWRNKSKSW